jgi:sodium/hydrogen exchanger family protein
MRPNISSIRARRSFSDPRESLRNIVAVLGQAVGLVVATAAVAAGLVLAVFSDLGWAAAIALGAAIAPPDPVAAGSVLQRLGVPRRLVAVLETEGLINDGVALTLFALAVGAVGARLGPGDVLLRLGTEVVGGIGFGVVVALVVLWLRRRVRDTPSLVALSLVTPYVAFLPAQSVHSSGVLATVTVAVWQSTRGRGLVEPTTRQQTETFWRVLNTLLQGVLFVLLGVQVPAIVAEVSEYPVWQLAMAGVAVVLAAVGTRMVWMVSVAPLLERLPVREELAADMTWRERALLAWCGPRGAVSLASRYRSRWSPRAERRSRGGTCSCSSPSSSCSSRSSARPYRCRCCRGCSGCSPPPTSWPKAPRLAVSSSARRSASSMRSARTTPVRGPVWKPCARCWSCVAITCTDALKTSRNPRTTRPICGCDSSK